WPTSRGRWTRSCWRGRILKAQLKGRLKLSDAERATLGEIGHRLGRKVLGEVATVARPDTILAWYRRWLEGPSRPGQTSDQTRGRAAARSHGQGELSQLRRSVSF